TGAPGLQERVRDEWVELCGRAALDLAERVEHRERTPVRTRRRHRVERVDDREQARTFWDIRTETSRRITGAVPALVVVEDVRDRFLRRLDRRYQPYTRRRVRTDLGQLVGAERAALAQDALRDHHLADVVQARAHLEALETRLVPAHPRGEPNRQVGYAC